MIKKKAGIARPGRAACNQKRPSRAGGLDDFAIFLLESNGSTWGRLRKRITKYAKPVAAVIMA